MNKKNSLLLLLLPGLAFFSEALYAEVAPAWETGAGLIMFNTPHYLGADQSSVYAFPLPYFIYRGEYIQPDRDGIRGAIYESEKLDLRLSGGGSLPVNSKDSDTREGMDDLDLVLEGGPTLQYQLYHSDHHIWRLELPVRAAFSIGSGIHYQGLTTNPRVEYRTYIDRWTLVSSLGPVFSSSSYHGYIYDIDQSDARPGREAYNAKSGYTGARFSLSFRRRYGRLFFGTFFSYYNISGAANEDSPLVKQDDYFSTGIAVAWVFAESKKMVDL